MKLSLINILLLQKFSNRRFYIRMKHYKGIYNKLKALLLLMAFLFTFALNSLHFTIFTHDHNCEHEYNGKSSSSFNETKSHTICQWEFAKSDSNKEFINLNSLDFIFITFPLKKYFRGYSKALRYYSLRAPPY